MSKLDELIQELCPDGVEYKTLGEVATNMFRGNGIKRDEVTEEGIPCVRYGEIYTTYGIHFDKCKSHTLLENVKSPKYFEYGDILFVITGESIEDIAKSTAYIGKEKCLAGGDIVVMQHEQNPKYISYALATTEAKKQKQAGKVKSKVVHASMPSIKEISIPVPPLPIQEEIVRILDKFTNATIELQKNLQAELKLRKKQYEYYRDALLTFEEGKEKTEKLNNLIQELCPDGVEYKTLGDCCKLSAGGDVPKRSMSKEKTDIYKIPIYSNGIDDNALYGYTDKAKIFERAITISARGTIGYCTLRKEPFYPIIRLITGVPYSNIVSADYLRYIINTIKFKVPEGGIPQLTVPMVSKISIPIPPLPIQEEIVRILDKFDSLCNDLSKGLPREIELRQKQYEYYRDKLLTFKVKER